eukprot:5708088-Prymnesium_polylepis.1
MNSDAGPASRVDARGSLGSLRRVAQESSGLVCFVWEIIRGKRARNCPAQPTEPKLVVGVVAHRCLAMWRCVPRPFGIS